jgi:PPOX class probable F420-dependent enzyme
MGAVGDVLPDGGRGPRRLTVPSLDADQIRRLVGGARVARLGTVDPDHGVHLVPVTFAFVGEAVVTAVDHKPKRSRRLRRVANIERNHHVTLLVDHYDEDWTRLWWCRGSGTARVIYQGGEFEQAVDALVARYQQYAGERPRGPVIKVAVDVWRGWASEQA